MYSNEWEPVYEEILNDLKIIRSSDEASARLLKMLTLNSCLISEDELSPLIGNEVIVVGGNVTKEDVTKLVNEKRTIISAGSATDVLIANDVIPSMVVTDLDGNTELQKKASALGSLLLVHAHGDNTELIAEHVKDIKGRMMITTQSTPDMILHNFGGFTDGDRAVCTARHFGAKKIFLIGFNFDEPAYKPNINMEMKKRKLHWAKKIIFDMNPSDVIIAEL